ncbi:hypothetical protein A0H81_04402 [Grifola frondosa]|uniref:Uncharacterized protein n=1 Tax=Grifola frondosa TaxID=5627 RepID=A0A1C7MFZ6_GRIFR|nr:hypothetical protein A0H81_04402 [Grifola frondosa]
MSTRCNIRPHHEFHVLTIFERHAPAYTRCSCRSQKARTYLIVGGGPTGLAIALSLWSEGCQDVTVADSVLRGDNTSPAWLSMLRRSRPWKEYDVQKHPLQPDHCHDNMDRFYFPQSDSF